MKIKKGIIVLYNQRVEFSSSYRKFRSLNLPLLVIDNSTESEYIEHNKRITSEDGNTYCSMGENAGLSKAYNHAIEILKEQSYEDYILMMDDDTDFPEDFLEAMEKAIEEHSADIYLPIVQAENHILSPCQIENDRIRELEDQKHIDFSKLSAINSGMVISMRVFDKIHYNEALFLDYVDHDFMRQVRNKNLKICILNAVVHQSFSLWADTKEKASWRIQTLKKDLNVFYGKGLKNWWLVQMIIMKRKLRYIARFKDISILWK